MVIGIVIAALVYLNKPAPKPAEPVASPEAKAYLAHLQLSNISMKAAENFMKQQVVEIEGDISNKGSRSLETVDVYCLFYGVDGRQVYRERVPILEPKAGSLKPGQTRSFRLPFDTLPDTWNQALPRMIIAQIKFER